MEQQNWEELMTVVQSIAAKGRRVAEVARTSLVSMKDPLEKEKVSEALKDLENSELLPVDLYRCCGFKNMKLRILQ